MTIAGFCQTGNCIQDCFWCNKKGSWKCDKCDSKGTLFCDYCNGTGYNEAGGRCPICKGEGRRLCFYCDGKKIIICEHCHGTGCLQEKPTVYDVVNQLKELGNNTYDFISKYDNSRSNTIDYFDASFGINYISPLGGGPALAQLNIFFGSDMFIFNQHGLFHFEANYINGFISNTNWVAQSFKLPLNSFSSTGYGGGGANLIIGVLPFLVKSPHFIWDIGPVIGGGAIFLPVSVEVSDNDVLSASYDNTPIVFYAGGQTDFYFGKHFFIKIQYLKPFSPITAEASVVYWSSANKSDYKTSTVYDDTKVKFGIGIKF